MMYRYLLSAFVFAVMLHASSVVALTCRNDYAGPGGCASNTTAAGDCATLGYFKYDVPDCDHYIVCPFDSSYKACVSGKCTNYNLTKCPDKGICISCQKNDTIKYALVDCAEGFALSSDNTCKKIYASCEEAGYIPYDKSQVCETENIINVAGTGLKACYTDCVCADGYLDIEGTCEKTYATCEEASYNTIKEHMECSNTADIYKPDGSKISCCTVETSCADGYIKDTNGVCIPSYASCVSAGLFDDNLHRECEGTSEITLPDGTSKTCYVGCTCSEWYEENASGLCVAKQCPKYSGTSITCSNNTMSVPNGAFSGRDPCYECESCSDGYAVNASYCGPNSLPGWHLSTSEKDSIGCYKCLVTQCPDGSAVGRKCLMGQEEVVDGYSAGKACIRCVGDPTPIEPEPDGCEDCGSGQWFICNGKCSVSEPNPGECLACFRDDIDTEVTPPKEDGSGNVGGGGGSGDDNPCMGPGDTSCECILYTDPMFCRKYPDNFCCDTNEEEGSTDTGVTIKP